MPQKEHTYEEILRELRAKRYRPVYYLMGEESFFIDSNANYNNANVLSESEKEFNQSVLYGNDVDVATIINACRRYPMMSEHQVIVVKEAQSVRNIDELAAYLRNPLPSTILVVCHQHGTLDRRKKLAAEVERTGILFESKKLKDGQLASFITAYAHQRSAEIDAKAVAMLVDFVGADAARMANELDKLLLALSAAGRKAVTPDLVEKHIGISKDYNNFELRNALIEKDILKANRIVKYFGENPKTNPIQVTLTMLFNFFSQLMLAYYAPQRTEQGVAAMLGLRSPWQAREYLAAMQKYSGTKTMQIIGEIRYADARSKGVGNSSLNSYDILRELVYRILH